MNLLQEPLAPISEIQSRLVRNRIEGKYLRALWKLSLRAMHEGAHEALIVRDKTRKPDQREGS